jgi:hypothetical protein
MAFVFRRDCLHTAAAVSSAAGGGRGATPKAQGTTASSKEGRCSGDRDAGDAAAIIDAFCVWPIFFPALTLDAGPDLLRTAAAAGVSDQVCEK